MNAGELYALFRSDVVDISSPYLWSADEVWRYMNDAYFMFVRLTGGIPDFTSAATAVPMTALASTSPLHPSILRIMHAETASDGRPMTIINSTDTPMLGDNDYGSIRLLWSNKTPGPVRYMLIGAQQHTAQWFQVPLVNDVANLTIYRLPLVAVTALGNQAFTDVNEEHHFHLLKWMKALAYQKQDAETFSPKQSRDNELSFRNYCLESKAELDRKKYKNRVVVYGGL